MSNGLSTRSFMTGLASGLNTGNQLANARQQREDAKRARERSEQQFEQQQKEWRRASERSEQQFEQQKKEWLRADERHADQQWSRLQDKAGRLIGMFRRGQINEEELRNGLNGLAPGSYDVLSEDSIRAGSAMQDAYTKLEGGEDPRLDQLNAYRSKYRKELDDRTKKDNRKRGIKQAFYTSDGVAPEGSVGFELEVTPPDGNSYSANMTRWGTSAADDPVVVRTPEQQLLDSRVMIYHGDLAKKWQAASGDKDKLTDVAYTMFGMVRPEEPKEPPTQYTYRNGYDRQGREALFQLDGQGNWKIVGGSRRRSNAELDALARRQLEEKKRGTEPKEKFAARPKAKVMEDMARLESQMMRSQALIEEAEESLARTEGQTGPDAVRSRKILTAKIRKKRQDIEKWKQQLDTLRGYFRD